MIPIELLEYLHSLKSVKLALYFLTSLNYVYYDIRIFKNHINESGYNEKFTQALDDIDSELNKNNNVDEIINVFVLKEPYFAYLLFNAVEKINHLTLAFLLKRFSLYDIFTVPLEVLPESCDEKYGLTHIGSECKANHQGIFYADKFYYFNPYLNIRRYAKETSSLIKILFDLKNEGNRLSLRLDNTISVEKNKYIPFYREIAEVYHGKEINLDEIEFPFNKGANVTLCVYKPQTMKKIQFKISHRKDSEKWIEVEDLREPREDLTENIINTRYLHSIFNQEENIFNHIDGSINLYNIENYKTRYDQTISSHSDSHNKLWLVEGNINVLEWYKLVLEFFEDYDLLHDAFTGNFTEEIFDENT